MFEKYKSKKVTKPGGDASGGFYNYSFYIVFEDCGRYEKEIQKFNDKSHAEDFAAALNLGEESRKAAKS